MEYAPDIVTTLDLERVDRDLFRGVNTVLAQSRPTLYGGQVAAQSLVAAARTVPDLRLPHSLHGYFLRPGLVDVPIVLRVDRDRDGRSFSSRHVSAMQDGEVIFSMLASFHSGEPEGVFGDDLVRDTPAPEDCPEWEFDPLLEMRQVTPTGVVDGRPRYSDRIWVRERKPLPDDPLLRAGVLTYISDYGTGFGQAIGPDLGIPGPSLDHSVWFHQDISFDDWVLVDLWPWKATPHRGVYQGVIRNRAGEVGATIVQEQLLRDFASGQASAASEIATREAALRRTR